MNEEHKHTALVLTIITTQILSMVFIVLGFVAVILSFMVLLFTTGEPVNVRNMIYLSPLAFMGAHIICMRLTKWLLSKEKGFGRPIRLNH